MKITFEVPDTTWSFAYCISYADHYGIETMVAGLATDYVNELEDGVFVRVEDAFEEEVET